MDDILDKIKTKAVDYEFFNNGRYPNLLLLGHHEFHEINKKITFPNKEFPCFYDMNIIRVFKDHCLKVGYIWKED